MSFTNSSLVNYTKLSPNHSGQRNHAIDTITIHCVVGQVSVERLGEIFAAKSRQASCNYGIGSDGRIALIVEEKNRSWCTSSSSNDNRAVTIEVASDTTHPYAVNAKAYDALIKLCADICKRNEIKKLLWKGDKTLIGQVSKQNMTVHRWFANKACPGEYLYSRHGEIADKVNKIIGAVASTEASKPAASKPAANTSEAYTGNSIVEYLKSVGKPSDFASRKKYAAQYGISNYTGTGAQNLKLLELMRGGLSALYYPKYTGESYGIDTVFRAIGVPDKFIGSWAKRKPIASANYVDNYVGAASQNTALITLAKVGKLRRP